jgi:hypothetical protein
LGLGAARREGDVFIAEFFEEAGVVLGKKHGARADGSQRQAGGLQKCTSGGHGLVSEYSFVDHFPALAIAASNMMQ